MTIFLLALVLVALAFAGIAIKLLVKKKRGVCRYLQQPQSFAGRRRWRLQHLWCTQWAGLQDGREVGIKPFVF